MLGLWRAGRPNKQNIEESSTSIARGGFTRGKIHGGWLGHRDIRVARLCPWDCSNTNENWDTWIVKKNSHVFRCSDRAILAVGLALRQARREKATHQAERETERHSKTEEERSGEEIEVYCRSREDTLSNYETRALPLSSCV